MIKVLLCDQNIKWLKSLKDKFHDNMELVDTVETGREVQNLINKTEVDVLIINVATKGFSIFEVVKFVKQNRPKTLIVMVAENREELGEYFYTEAEILKIGIVKYFVKPFPVYHMIKFIEDSFKHKLWSDLKPIESDENGGEGDPVSESDQRFSSLEYKDFGNQNIAIFDLYLRIGKNKYLMVFKRGEKVDFSRLSRYLEKDPDLKLYFKSSERISYINFSNEMIKRALNKHKSTPELMKMVNSSTKLLIEEIYTQGLPEHIVEESQSTCENIYKSVSANEELKSLMKELFDLDDSEEAHVSLTAFYTAISCKNIDWVTAHSRNNIIMGAILHDIGKVRLSKKIRNKPVEELKEKEFEEFCMHPEYGVDILDGLVGISEQVKQIVYQHHELNNAEGYPNRLLGRKIYPLAKIVCFSNFLANYSIKHKLSPLKAIKKAMEEKVEIMKYEPFVIKAFLKGFIKDV